MESLDFWVWFLILVELLESLGFVVRQGCVNCVFSLLLLSLLGCAAASGEVDIFCNQLHAPLLISGKMHAAWLRAIPFARQCNHMLLGTLVLGIRDGSSRICGAAAVDGQGRVGVSLEWDGWCGVAGVWRG